MAHQWMPFDLATIGNNNSALNQSWLCPVELKDTPEPCIFIFEHQFNRKLWYSNYLEGGILALVSLAAFPMNIAAVVTYRQRGAGFNFLMLIGCLVACNLAYASICLLRAFAR